MSLWPARRKKRIFIKYLAVLLILLFILPLTLLVLFDFEGEETRIEGDTVTVRLLQHESKKVLRLGLEEYVVGVVAAEMPASFSLEALKAQAVAARTYAVKRLQLPDPRIKNINPEADLSSDPAINQAWISSEEMKNRWGPLNYGLYKKKITRAVVETKGKVLVYGGQLIDPVYHASCGGCGTENSEDVWANKMPYLRRVACSNHPAGNKEAELAFGLADLDRLLGTSLNTLPAGRLTGSSGAIQLKEKTSSGRVKTVMVGSKVFSGTELRVRLKLPSTWFEWEVVKDKVKIKSKGYGHAVGMCQYGAAALAKEGKDYAQILTHYYQGVVMATVKN